MKIIIIEGVIGWEYTASDHRKQLEEAAGDDLDIQISSPGGSVYDGNTIKQLTEKYKRDYPNSSIIITTYGMSMSMGSIIALSGDEHHVHEDSTYMIHNPWASGIGDYREMGKMADFLEKLSNMSARVYSRKSRKAIEEIRILMDEETFYFGKEIIDAGFADKLIKKKDNKKTDKSESIAYAKLAVEDTISRMKSEKFDFQDDLLKAVALIKDDKEIKIPASAGKNKQTEVIMDLEQLKKDHPGLYAQVVQIGKDEEFDRVSAHITMGESANSFDIAVKHIKEKTGFSQSVSAEYMSAGMKNQSLQNRQDDDVNTGGQAGGDDDEADTKAFVEKIKKTRGKV